jgi:hypothetical protein
MYTWRSTLPVGTQKADAKRQLKQFNPLHFVRRESK